MLVTTLKSKSAGCHSNQRNEGDFGIINLKISYCEPPKRGRRSERRGERRAYKSREDLYSDKIEIGQNKSCSLFVQIRTPSTCMHLKEIRYCF